MKAEQVVIPVSDLSHVGEVRRLARGLAARADLPETECEKASIVATELATNLARYAAGGGEMILSSVTANGSVPDHSSQAEPTPQMVQ